MTDLLSIDLQTRQACRVADLSDAMDAMRPGDAAEVWRRAAEHYADGNVSFLAALERAASEVTA